MLSLVVIETKSVPSRLVAMLSLYLFLKAAPTSHPFDLHCMQDNAGIAVGRLVRPAAEQEFTVGLDRIFGKVVDGGCLGRLFPSVAVLVPNRGESIAGLNSANRVDRCPGMVFSAVKTYASGLIMFLSNVSGVTFPIHRRGRIGLRSRMTAATMAAVASVFGALSARRAKLTQSHLGACIRLGPSGIHTAIGSH